MEDVLKSVADRFDDFLVDPANDTLLRRAHEALQELFDVIEELEEEGL